MYFDQTEFGKRLHDIRILRGLTQEALAEKVSVEKQHISRMERGVNACSIDLLIEMACVLNVSTDYLLMGKSVCSEHTKDKLLEVIGQLTEVVREI